MKKKIKIKIDSNNPMKRKINIYTEIIPDHYEGNTSVTIKCKKSEVPQIAYDIKSVLYDAVDVHPQFQDVLIEESIDG
jgi:hypothetical protein